MVLTQQKGGKHEKEKATHVSIPLWFSRNQKRFAPGYTSGRRFHTTMVLTQPLLLQRYYTGFG